MHRPSRSTRVPVEAEPASLARVPVGWRRRVVSVADSARPELEREGILPGAVVVVTARTPIGGPVVVELGRARLALSAGVARLVATEPYADPIAAPFPAPAIEREP
jgi:Fe2+ transport system protein FeoA